MATIQNENAMRRMTAALVGFVLGAEISYEPETSASSASSAVVLIQRRHSTRGGTTKAAAAAPAKK
jgi:hypothetical protein